MFAPKPVGGGGTKPATAAGGVGAAADDFGTNPAAAAGGFGAAAGGLGGAGANRGASGLGMAPAPAPGFGSSLARAGPRQDTHTNCWGEKGARAEERSAHPPHCLPLTDGGWPQHDSRTWVTQAAAALEQVGFGGQVGSSSTRRFWRAAHRPTAVRSSSGRRFWAG